MTCNYAQPCESYKHKLNERNQTQKEYILYDSIYIRYEPKQK